MKWCSYSLARDNCRLTFWSVRLSVRPSLSPSVHPFFFKVIFFSVFPTKDRQYNVLLVLLVRLSIHPSSIHLFFKVMVLSVLPTYKTGDVMMRYPVACWSFCPSAHLFFKVMIFSVFPTYKTGNVMMCYPVGPSVQPLQMVSSLGRAQARAQGRPLYPTWFTKHFLFFSLSLGIIEMTFLGLYYY